MSIYSKGMRKLLVVLLPLLAALAIGCGGGESKLPACPTPSASEATFSPPPTPPSPSAADVSKTVWDGARLLEDHYVDQISRVKLLEAAWDGTRDELQEHTIPIPDSIDPNHNKASSTRDREAQLRTAFEKLAESVDSTKLSSGHLVEIALTAMADSLNDGHTTYIPGPEWHDEQQNRITSLGFRSRAFGSGYVVVDVLPGSSAESAGLLRGDLVSAVNGQSLANGISNLRPPIPGEPTTVTYSRQGGPNQQVELQTKPVALPPVRDDLLEGQIGLLQMYTFPSSEGCDFISAFRASFDSAVSDLKSRGATSWVLDLRNNPGGATAIASFVAGSLGFDGTLAEIRRRGGSHDTLETTGNSQIAGAPLVILVNERSASSSEIVAGAMQDAKAGYVIGNTTAGEVAAAAEYAIADGGMEITVGRVAVGPSQKSLEKYGIMPDLRTDLDLNLLATQGRDSQIEAAVTYLKSKTH